MFWFILFLFGAAPFLLVLLFVKRAKQKTQPRVVPQKRNLSGWQIILISLGVLFVASMYSKGSSNDPAHIQSTLNKPSPESLAEAKRTASTMESLAFDAVKSRLKDPASALFKDVAAHETSKGAIAVCGQVNSKNSFGGYGGFEGFITNGLPNFTLLQSDILPDKRWREMWRKACT